MVKNVYLKISTDETTATFYDNAAGTGTPVTRIDVNENADIFFKKCTGENHWKYDLIAFRETSAPSGGTTITAYVINPATRTYPEKPNTSVNSPCVVYQDGSWTQLSTKHDFTLKARSNDQLQVQDSDADKNQSFEYYIYIETTGIPPVTFVVDPQIYNQSGG